MPSILKTSLAIICLQAFASHAQDPSRAVAAVEVPQAASAPASTQWLELNPADTTTRAQSAALASEASPPPPEQPDWRITIGQSTQDLLSMQRASQGVRLRPIDGEQASRSYQRYLKSFETEIPEQFDTGLGVKKR
ncbi:hypothetical protein GCM10027082_08380 [Comamonas humi]